jgi:hypothetical protein
MSLGGGWKWIMIKIRDAKGKRSEINASLDQIGELVDVPSEKEDEALGK